MSNTKQQLPRPFEGTLEGVYQVTCGASTYLVAAAEPIDAAKVFVEYTAQKSGATPSEDVTAVLLGQILVPELVSTFEVVTKRLGETITLDVQVRNVRALDMVFV